MEDYRVQLDFYDGPMDLLLYLVRKEEVDIHDIPIARITEQYCRYVEMLRALDIDLAGEFLLMAAWLMEIKTRLLLPTDTPATPEEGAPAGQALAEGGDPRAELVRQLLAYKRFKDLADELGVAAACQALKYPRAGIDWKQLAGQNDEPPAVDLADVQIWDLFEAFGRLMDATGRASFHNVTYDDTPIQEHEADIVDRLTQAGELPFSRLFEGRGRGQIIGLFLAMLELIRRKRVRFRQDQAFGSIVLSLRAEGEPAEPGSQDGHASGSGSQPQASGGDSPVAHESVAEKIARRRARAGEPSGVTWVEPAADDEDVDQGLRAIDQELKSIRMPPDPEMLITQPIDGPTAAQLPAGSPPPESVQTPPAAPPAPSPEPPTPGLAEPQIEDPN